MAERVSSDSGHYGWFLQRLTGFVLLFFLVAHFWYNHFASGGAYTYQGVVNKLSSPFGKTMEMTFLVVSLYHGLNGIWMLVEDYIQPRWARQSLMALLLISGFFLFSMGIITIIPFMA